MYIWKAGNVALPPKILVILIMLTIAVFGGFAAVTKMWTFKIDGIDPEFNSAVLISEGDLGSRIYSLCASQALSEAAGLRLRVKWLSDPWVPATRFHDLFENPIETEDLVSRIDAQFFLKTGKWKSWRDEALRASFWKVESKWQCREGTEARDVDLLNFTQPAWLKHLPVPTSLYVTSQVAGCSMWGPKHYIDPCLVADQVSNCYRYLQPSKEVVQLLDKVDIQGINASTGVLYQTGPPTEAPPLPPSCSSLREGAGRRLSENENNQKKMSTASATSRRSQLRPNTVEAFSPQYCLSRWEKQAIGTTERMINERNADQELVFLLGGALPAALDNITEQFLEDARPFLLPYPTEPIKELCGGMEFEGVRIPTFSIQQVQTRMDSLRWPLVTCMRHQLAILLSLSASEGIIYSFPGGDVDFIGARAHTVSNKSFVMHEPIGKIEIPCKDGIIKAKVDSVV